MEPDRKIGNFYYRYLTCRGLERRECFSRHFNRATGAMLEELTWQELEGIAHLIRDALKEPAHD